MFYFLIWTTATNRLSITLSLTVCFSVCLSVNLPLSLRLSKSLDARHSGGRSSPWISVQGIFILLLFPWNAWLAHARCDRRRRSCIRLQRCRPIILGRHIVNRRVHVCHKSRRDSISDGTFKTVPTCEYRIIIIYYTEYNATVAAVASRSYLRLVAASSRWVHTIMYVPGDSFTTGRVAQLSIFSKIFSVLVQYATYVYSALV